jgi:hypothetical protein
MSEFLQLDQYNAQGMFGQPVPQLEDMAVFHSVWTYAIKAVDSRKKARWACDGSPRSGQEKTKHTQTALTRQVRVSSMQLCLRRT